MLVKLWGTRGSLATTDREMAKYGGNTTCVEVRGQDGTVLVLDAGTGIRPLGNTLTDVGPRIDLLLTHLHMDHIQGLGFFAPLFDPSKEVHIWGPASTTLSLQARITRYLSPPLFPIRLNELPCTVILHELPCPAFDIGELHIQTMLICHPGPTIGYRITENYPHGPVFTFLPDHEPALGLTNFPIEAEWTSGYALAKEADLLLHDSQYKHKQYLAQHVGWGHSSIDDALKFAALCRVKQFVPFHYDPSHTDLMLDQMIAEALTAVNPPFHVLPGQEGQSFIL